MLLKCVCRAGIISIKGIFPRWYSNSQKVANLGQITDYLVVKGVPNLLQKNVQGVSVGG